MVYRLLIMTITIAICIGGSTLLLTGCATDSNSGDERPQCGEDNCIQPPLRRAELQQHLKDNQDRILSRDDYKNHLPPPISDVIYGPLPDGQLRDGPPVVDGNDNPYDGQLNWHHIKPDEVDTDDADHHAMKGRQVSGAQCLFSRKPNRLTSIFALLVVHHPTRGDLLYFGGPHQHVTRIDTVPITDHHPSPIRVDTDQGIRCVFRDDQNRQGALVVPFRYTDIPEPSNGPHYAVFEISVGTEKYDTGLTETVPRTTGVRGDRVVDHEVPVRRYPRPRIEARGSYTSEFDAIEAAEKFITASDFRLRPEFVYPVMPYLSYLNTGKEEFCPVNVECKTPPKYLNKDIVPPLDAAEEALEEETAEDERDETAGDEHDEADEG